MIEPVRSRRAHWLGFLAVLLASLLLPSLPLTQRLELPLLDRQFQLRRQLAPVAGPEPVVLVGIDEATYRAYPEPFALWHPHLGDLFKGLALGGARAVGLDLAFPDRSYNAIASGYDQRLMQGMLALRKVAPLTLGITIDQGGNPRPVYPPFLSLAGKEGQAFVLWKLDPDRVVRRFDPDLGGADKPLPTLVSRMAAQLGVRAEPGLIDFAAGKRIGYLPFHQVVGWFRDGNADALKRHFEGRAVLVGTVLPFEDRHYQPVNLAAWEPDNNNFVPGVLIHVQALRNLLDGGFVRQIPDAWVYLILLPLCLLWWLGARPAHALALLGSVILLLLGAQWWLLGQKWLLPAAPLLLAAVLAVGGRQALELGLQILERRRLRGVFQGYVSPQVLEEILSGRLEPGVSGKQCRACVMFSDIRNFTTLSEKMPATEVLSFLNRYLGEMTEAIQGNQGTLDKFIGDGIMAIFGAPQSLDNPARNAFAASIEKLQRLERLNEVFVREGRPRLAIGIGLHLGEVVVGNVGSAQRNDYTAIGDVVNTASRLEGLTKQLGYPLVVSAAVYQALGTPADFDPLGEMPVKGHSPVDIYGWPAKTMGSAP